MSTSRTDIMNDALRLLGVRPIADPAERSEAARQVNAVYYRVVRFELEQYPWFFAKREAALAALTTGPAFKYARAYQVPSDFLRLVELADRWVYVLPSAIDAAPVPPFELYGRTIRTDLPAPLRITYTADLSDTPDQWSPAFMRLAAAALARDLATTLVKSDGAAQAALSRYRELELRARRSAAVQQAPTRVGDGSWLTGRLY